MQSRYQFKGLAQIDMVCDSNPVEAARRRPRAYLFNLNSRQETPCCAKIDTG